jgi:hypothetical protein
MGISVNVDVVRCNFLEVLVGILSEHRVEEGALVHLIELPQVLGDVIRSITTWRCIWFGRIGHQLCEFIHPDVLAVRCLLFHPVGVFFSLW